MESCLRLQSPRSLSAQFVMAGGLLMVVVMLVAGYLINAVVARDAVHATAASTALFMHAITGDVVAELTDAPKLSPRAIEKLDELFVTTSFRERFPYLEIWSTDGTVIYSNSRELIGQRFDPSDGLLRALKGDVASEYTDLSAREHSMRAFDRRFLEIYTPLRTPDGSVVAVAEIHEFAEPLQRQLAYLTRITWAVVAGSTLLIGLSLFGLVHRGSTTIERQKMALRERIQDAERAAETNRSLRDRVRRAAVRVSELNEDFLKRVGADLHDGPIQLLSFATLQASHLRSIAEPEKREDAVRTLLKILDDASRDIRSLSKGLLMPEVTGLTLKKILMEAVTAHEARTGTTVHAALEGADVVVPPAVTACSYRFLQEGLNNAYRHSLDGSEPRVVAAMHENVLSISVMNEVGNPREPNFRVADRGLGLRGLRSRVESLGGSVSFEASREKGARLEMRLNVSDEIFSDGVVDAERGLYR